MVRIERQFAKTFGLARVAGGKSHCHTLSFFPFKMEEEHLYALRWKELEMHSLALQNTLHERTWSDERNLMQQELRSLKQNIFLFYVKLRWLLKLWRQGKQMEEEGEDFTEVPLPRAFVLFASVLFLPPRHCCPSAFYIQSHTLPFHVILSGPTQAMEMQQVVELYIRPRIPCCPLTSFLFFCFFNKIETA